MENHFSHYQAIKDCFSLKFFKYALKLIRKKLLVRNSQSDYYLQVDEEGKTLMHYFCQSADFSKEALEVYHALKGIGFDQNQRDKKGNKPVNYLIQAKNFKLFLLICREYQIDFNYQNSEGHTLFADFLVANYNEFRGYEVQLNENGRLGRFAEQSRFPFNDRAPSKGAMFDMSRRVVSPMF